MFFYPFLANSETRFGIPVKNKPRESVQDIILDVIDHMCITHSQCNCAGWRVFICAFLRWPAISLKL